MLLRSVFKPLNVILLGIGFIGLSSSLIAGPCDEATDLNYQAYESYRQGFPLSRSKFLLEQALRLCPKQAETYNNLAELFSEEGNETQAIAHYQKALEINPNLSTAWYGLGETYYKQNQFPLSLEAHLQACQTDKDSRKRVIALLKNNRYAVTESGEIIKKESLLVLYDKQRRQKLNQLIAGCGLKAVAGSVTNTHVFRNFHFDSSKASLQLGSEGQLQEIAGTLRVLYKNTVHIHGHTDSQVFTNLSIADSDRRNWELSYARAKTIGDALNEQGVSFYRIKIHAHGYSDPVELGTDPTVLAKNRRVEIEVE
jgi:outer membrane protein OmpA-like peptidoglycan-associated protein